MPSGTGWLEALAPRGGGDGEIQRSPLRPAAGVRRTPVLSRLTQACASLTREVRVNDEHGEQRVPAIPAERPLTTYVDELGLVILMTLSAHLEWLVLRYPRNGRLTDSVQDVAVISVDWEVGAASRWPC